MKIDIDLGLDHKLSFSSWNPELDINPQYEKYRDQLPVDKFGASITHKKPNGDSCRGHITFDSEIAREVSPGSPKWQVQSWDPLTISPSILCLAENCGDHGFIREGRWVPA